MVLVIVLAKQAMILQQQLPILLTYSMAQVLQVLAKQVPNQIHLLMCFLNQKLLLEEIV